MLDPLKADQHEPVSSTRNVRQGVFHFPGNPSVCFASTLPASVDKDPAQRPRIRHHFRWYSQNGQAAQQAARRVGDRSPEGCFPSSSIVFGVPPLILNGSYHYWKYVFSGDISKQKFWRGRKMGYFSLFSHWRSELHSQTRESDGVPLQMLGFRKRSVLEAFRRLNFATKSCPLVPLSR